MVVSFLYIHKMKGCECTDKNVVDKLHTLEIFFMGLSVFLLVSVFIFRESFIKTGMSKHWPKFVAFAYAYLSLWAYFVYLVYEFYLGVSECKCADDPMKYALYVQAGSYSITLVICTIISGAIVYTLAGTKTR
jgi:hypothetical protein